MRLNGCDSIGRLRYAILETNGQISFKAVKPGPAARRRRVVDFRAGRHAAVQHRAAANVLRDAGIDVSHKRRR